VLGLAIANDTQIASLFPPVAKPKGSRLLLSIRPTPRPVWIAKAATSRPDTTRERSCGFDAVFFCECASGLEKSRAKGESVFAAFSRLDISSLRLSYSLGKASIIWVRASRTLT
jgi:hypothetical protein